VDRPGDGDLAGRALTASLTPDGAGEDVALSFSDGHTFLQAKKYPLDGGLLCLT
jgi:hypothetical protein